VSVVETKEPSGSISADPGEASITVESKFQVLTHVDQLHYSVRRSDWKRLERTVDKCKPAGTSLIEGAAWALYGIAASALFSILSLAASPDDAIKALPSWIRPAYWAVFIGGGLVGTALVVVAKKSGQIVKDTIENLRDDMRDIEEMCVPPRSSGKPPQSGTQT
jgi:hypothetical protein